MTADPPPYPIVVGVTGHRDIASGGREAVAGTVHAVLHELRAKFGAALHVMTALADGSDQLVADVAEALDLKTIVVSLMPRTGALGGQHARRTTLCRNSGYRRI